MSDVPKIVITVRVEGATACVGASATLHIDADDAAVRSLFTQAQEIADSCADMIAESIAIVDGDPLS